MALSGNAQCNKFCVSHVVFGEIVFVKDILQAIDVNLGPDSPSKDRFSPSNKEYFMENGTTEHLNDSNEFRTKLNFFSTLT